MGTAPLTGAGVVRAAQGLRAWTSQIADAAREVGVPERARAFRLVAEADAGLATVDEALVRTTGWELRDAVDWSAATGDCDARAALTALSLAQRHEGGDLVRAYANLAGADERLGAMLVAFAPQRPGLAPLGARAHAAAAFQGPDGLLVVDHLLAPGGDGVLPAERWLHEVRPRDPRHVAYVSAVRRPPYSATGGAGIGPVAAVRTPDDWRHLGEHLATALERGATATT